MRKALLVVIALVVASAPVQVWSVEQGQAELGFGVGAGVPFGDFGDLANTGFALSANVGYIVTPHSTLGIETVFNHFPVSSEVEALLGAFAGTSVDASYRVFQFIMYGKFLFADDNFSPYVKVAFGLYNVGAKVEVAGVSATESEGRPGFGGGLGAQFKGESMVGGFFEALFHAIIVEDDTTNYAQFRGGVTFFFGGN